MNQARFNPVMRAILYVFLVVCTLLSIFPFYWMFVIGSNTTSAVSSFPPALVPGSFFIDNAWKVLDRIPFFKGLLNSLIVSGSITLAVLFFSSLAGFAFAKLRFPGKQVLFIAVIATMMVPLQLGIIPQYMIVSRFGWVDTLWAVIIPAVANAFGVFWMRQYISSSVPDELLESGRIDGCSTFRLYRSIVLPSVRPALATLGIITFMNHWNDFLWPLIVLKNEGIQTIQIMLRRLNDAYYTDYALVLAGTFMATLPILIVFLLFSKQFIAGITEGAIKQ